MQFIADYLLDSNSVVWVTFILSSIVFVLLPQFWHLTMDYSHIHHVYIWRIRQPTDHERGGRWWFVRGRGTVRKIVLIITTLRPPWPPGWHVWLDREGNGWCWGNIRSRLLRVNYRHWRAILGGCRYRGGRYSRWGGRRGGLGDGLFVGGKGEEVFDWGEGRWIGMKGGGVQRGGGGVIVVEIARRTCCNNTLLTLMLTLLRTCVKLIHNVNSYVLYDIRRQI